MKFQIWMPILSVNILASFGGGVGGDPTIQPTSIEDDANTFTGVRTKSVSAGLTTEFETTSLSGVSNGNNGSWRVVSDNSGVDTILISDGANVNVVLRSDQMTAQLFEDDAAETLVVAQSNDGSKILKFVSDEDNYAAGFAAEIDLFSAISHIAVFDAGEDVFALPDIPNARYEGTLVGVLTEVGYRPVQTTADLLSYADFQNKTLSVSADNTIAFNIEGQEINDDYSSQNFFVMLTDTDSDNTFEGNVTDNEGKTGSITATLYGPEAQGVAGTGYVEHTDPAIDR